MATKTKTPAEIPAENTAAHSTEYEPLLNLGRIHTHPRNPRHNAVADDELIVSIREQGLIHDLVVAPHPSRSGEFILIDGHRRLDGLTKAGFTFAPAKIRLDLVDEGAQVAAMLATVRREDLTPVEEAEGFDLLSELGWSTEQIAAATGRSKTTVTERRKLTRLPEKAKAAVDVGQVTIDDALRLAKLPVPEQADLERRITSSDFKYELARTETRVKAAKEVDAQAKDYAAQGVPEVPCPKGVQNEYSLTHANHGMTRLAASGFPDLDDHPECAAFVRGGTKQYPGLWLVCTDPTKHDEQLTGVQAENAAHRASEEAEREARLQEWAEKREAERVARQMRCDAIVSAIKPKALDPILETLIRLALPDMLTAGYVNYCDIVEELLDVPADQRTDSSWIDVDAPWLNDIAYRTSHELTKSLAALLVSLVESNVSALARGSLEPQPRDPASAADYFALLGAAGHELNTIDQTLRNEALGHEEAAS